MILGSSRGTGRTALRNVDHTGGAADAESRGRRRNLHLAGLGDQASDESRRAGRDVKDGDIGATALLINEFVDDNARICGKVEGRLVIEGNAQRGIRAGRQRIVPVDGVVDLQRDGCSRIDANDRGAALQSGDFTYLVYLIGGSLI